MSKQTHPCVRSPAEAVAQIKPIPSGTVVLLLDRRYQLIQIEPIEGDGQAQREAITRAAFREHAAAVIVGHRLPLDAVPEPSVDDCRAYRDIDKALREIDVHLVDDITVGNAGYRSILEAGSLAMLKRGRPH